MTYILFPGRHHLLTAFQSTYLKQVIAGEPSVMVDVDGKPISLTSPVKAIVWAVTSANHSNTRRNPLPAHRREVAIENFSSSLSVPSLVYLIDDLGTTDRFAEYVLKKIDVDSGGTVNLTPANTLVACSTPEVLAQYESLGFTILPVELFNREKVEFREDPPWKIMQDWIRRSIADACPSDDDQYRAKVANATRVLYRKYGYDQRIIDLHRSMLLTEDGDLTGTRDYNTYVRSFDSGATRKYDLIRGQVQPGRVVDIGCCTGALIREMTLDPTLRESDFYGIEVARQLYTECLHRKEQGIFGEENVFFYQRDFAAGPIFENHSVNTFTTFALTHEIESYGNRDALLRFIDLLRKQLTLGGRWLNVDVIGPKNRDERIWMELSKEDGRNEDWDREFTATQNHELSEYLSGLSTYGRFLRFAKDFRHSEGYRLPFDHADHNGTKYIAISMQDACEFLSKKDYTDNWLSEMHETFCFWSYSEWCEAVRKAGFTIHPASYEYTNPWIVANRWQGKVKLYRTGTNGPERIPYPVTNMVMIAVKR
ncbi:MAG: hypothetical protein RLY14_2742, partial [Planctomycetota bacterium]|jgi:hypothetical protein